MENLSFGVAFAAGILSFFSPCVLPLLPVYLSVLAGSNNDNLVSNTNSLRPQRTAKNNNGKNITDVWGNVGHADSKFRCPLRNLLFINTISFILGFSAVFILLGVSVSALSQCLLFNRIWLTKIAGAFVVFFGLFLLGVFNLPFLMRELHTEMHFKKVTPISALFLGSAFSLGWTPCIGPVLSSVLFMAGSTQNYVTGFWMLLVFSLGLAIPFLILSLAADRAMGFLRRSKNYLPYLQKSSGAILIVMGTLLFFNRLA